MLPQYDYAEAQLKLLKEQADNSRDLMEEIYNRVNEGYIKTSDN
jgi:cytochrome c-type biogenesis protein CcmH/NrfF